MTKSSKPCRAAATEGGLCFFHANPNKAIELGRIGGTKSGRIPVGTEPLPNLDSSMAVRDTVTRLIADVYAGKLHPRIASGLAPLMISSSAYWRKRISSSASRKSKDS